MAQTAEAVALSDSGGCQTETITAPAAGACGQVIQLADGRAAVAHGADASAAAYASGASISVATSGQFSLLKTASVALLAGGRVYWDRSANTATFRAQSGDFFIGKVVADVAGSASTVVVDLNVEPTYQIELHKGQWVNEATDGLGVTKLAEGSSVLKLAFDAVAEVAQAALYSVDTIPLADLGIIEGKVAIYDIGDHAALDISFGIANGSHGTDFDAVTESVVFHLDGTALSVLAESDDTSGDEVAATDTTVDAVDDTYLEFWIDCRDINDIQLYLDGVNVLPATAFTLAAADGPFVPIVHLEKTSNDTTADVRVEFLRARSTDLAV